MKLSIDTSTISFRALGVLLAFAGLCLALGWCKGEVTFLLPLAILLVLGGFVLTRIQGYFIRNKREIVRAKVAACLAALEIGYEATGAGLKLHSSGSEIKMRQCGPLTLVSFFL